MNTTSMATRKKPLEKAEGAGGRPKWLAELPDRIKICRESAGMTQRQFAQAFGMDQGQVSRWERGVNGPRPAELQRIADLGSADIFWLLTGIGGPHDRLRDGGRTPYKSLEKFIASRFDLVEVERKFLTSVDLGLTDFATPEFWEMLLNLYRTYAIAALKPKKGGPPKKRTGPGARPHLQG